MAKDKEQQEQILLKNSNINIFLPENIKAGSNILIFGNTCNFFGVTNNIIFNNDNELDRLGRLIDAINNKCNFYIICSNKETYEYYHHLFNEVIYHNFGIKAQVKALELIEVDSTNTKKEYKNKYANKVFKKINQFNMHFDICLMNPPYNRDLHLKFLEKTISYADMVISIQPIRWLEDIFAKYKHGSDYKKYNQTIYKYISSLEKIDKENASKLFGIESTINLGIYKCNKFGGYNNENNELVNKIVEKTISNSWDNYNCKKMEGKPLKKYIIRTTGIAGGKNPLMCVTYERQLQVKAPNPKSHNANNCAIFSFDTEKERKNFYDCYNSPFMKWHCSLWKTDIHANTKNIPYFNDYTKQWTNEMFYEYFELTIEEIQIVEEYMNIIKENEAN